MGLLTASSSSDACLTAASSALWPTADAACTADKISRSEVRVVSASEAALQRPTISHESTRIERKSL